MNVTVRKIVLGVASVTLFVAGTAVYAQQKVLRHSFNNQLDHPEGIGAQKFAELVAKKSNGRIVVKPFAAGVLGGDLQSLSGIRAGNLDMTSMNAGNLNGVVKEFIVFDFPFLFPGSKEADAIMDGPVGKKMFDKLPEHGIIGLAYFDNGFRNLTNSKRPIVKIEDIKGLKIRTMQNPICIDMFNTLGANATPLPMPEVFTALEQKTVDGQENQAHTIEASKIYEVQKYMTLTRHMYNPMALMMSKKTWDKFSPEDQKILREAAQEAAVYQRQASREQNQQATERMQKAGMQVNELSAQEQAALREKVKPVTDKYVKEVVGEALYKEFVDEIAKAHGK